MTFKEAWKNLYAYAKTIPALGYGGKSIAHSLIKYAGRLPSGSAIVDLAPWLGSTTAFLALGVMKHGPNFCNRDIVIFSYDKWKANKEYMGKALEHNGLEFKKNLNLRPLYLKNIEPFPVKVTPTKIDISKIAYSGDRKILLLVDDICNTKKLLTKMMSQLYVNFVPNKTIVLSMDYYFHETKPDLFYQKNFYFKNQKSFKFIERLPNSKTAVFKYMGGGNFDFQCSESIDETLSDC